MAAAAKDKEFAQKAGVPQKVAKEFHAADKAVHGCKTGRTKRQGGR